MPTPQRITNCHRAAVCGLMLLGVGYVKSCRIVAAPDHSLRGYLGKDWWGRGAGRSSRRWRGDSLRDLEEAYRDRALKLETIAALFKTTKRVIQYLAVRHGWPKRTRGKGAPLPTPLGKLDAETRNRFKKLRKILGRSAAEQAVFG